MKVAYLVPYNWGGMIHYTAELANAVSQYADVIVLGSKSIPKYYFSNNINLINIFDDFNFTLSNLPTVLTYSNLNAFFSFRKISILKDINPDIIHFTTPLMHIPLFILLFNINSVCPSVYTIHSPHQENDFLTEKIYYLDCLISSLVSYKRIIVHSRRDKDEIIQKENYSEKDIAVIPHGTYDIFMKYAKRDNLKSEFIGNNTILFFGYLKKYKGLEYLLRAIPFIYREIPNIKLIIAGEGDIAPYYNLINKYDPSIYEHIEVYNKYISDDKVSILFQQSSVVVLPYSQMTGQSGVITIAHAFGKPIVATNVWAFHEVVDDGKTGYLVPPKDPKALAEAIIKILTNDNIRADMELNSFKKAQELSWDNIALKHIDVYKEAIG